MTLEVDQPHIDREHDFSIKVGNTTPALGATLKDNEENPVDLSNASVDFKMKKIGGTTKVDAAASFVTDGSDGKVAYDWNNNDTDEAGEYIGEFVVTYNGGKVETFPRDGHISIEIDSGV